MTEGIASPSPAPPAQPTRSQPSTFVRPSTESKDAAHEGEGAPVSSPPTHDDDDLRGDEPSISAIADSALSTASTTASATSSRSPSPSRASVSTSDDATAATSTETAHPTPNTKTTTTTSTRRRTVAKKKVAPKPRPTTGGLGIGFTADELSAQAAKRSTWLRSDVDEHIEIRRKAEASAKKSADIAFKCVLVFWLFAIVVIFHHVYRMLERGATHNAHAGHGYVQSSLRTITAREPTDAQAFR